MREVCSAVVASDRPERAGASDEREGEMDRSWTTHGVERAFVDE